MEQINAIVEANPEATCGDLLASVEVFGLTLPRRSETMFAKTVYLDDADLTIVDVYVFLREGQWSIDVTASSGEISTTFSTKRMATLADTRWLQEAALHAPILCGRVVDLMPCQKCDHGTLEAEDHDGYATARFCDCAEGEALREADERDVPKWAVGR